MCWTPDGEQVLQGAEAKLFKEALATIVSVVRDDYAGTWRFHIPCFDDLRPNQKLALLAQVGSALLDEDEPMPKLTAVLEAAVGAVFETVRVMVGMEVEEEWEWGESPSWRKLVLAASRERGIDDLPDVECEDVNEWEVLVDSLAGGVLWDEDWKETGDLLDADPRESRAVNALMGIDTDYYIAIPPDPTDREMEIVWATLRALTPSNSMP